MLIDTIEEYFGIPIHHYVQVDFAGFQELVDAVGGVTVYFPAPARDRTRASTSTRPAASPSTASRRSPTPGRATTSATPDGRWRTDPTGDLGRISRQQDFIIRALHQAVEQGARNPITLDRLVDAGLATVTVDDLLTADDIIRLGHAFRSFNPGSSRPTPSRVARLGGRRVGPPAAGRGGPADPRPVPGHRSGELRTSDVRVQVLNGSGITGHARETSDALTAAGFGSAGTGEAERSTSPSRWCATRPATRSPRTWSALAGSSARLELVDGPLGADVVVVTGSELTGVRTEPRPGPVDHPQHDDHHRRAPPSSRPRVHHLDHGRRLRAAGARLGSTAGVAGTRERCICHTGWSVGGKMGTP